MQKKTKSGGALAALAALLSLSQIQLTAAEEAAPAPVANAAPTVSVLKAEKKPIAATLTVTGSFAAGELVLVSPEIEGLAVVEFLAEEGDEVKKGQLLARLSSAQVDIDILKTKASLASKEAAISRARNLIEQAKITEQRSAADLNRTKKLRSSGVSSVEQFDQRQAEYNLAYAQLDSANLGLALAEADLEVVKAQMAELDLRKARTEIKAPVGGYISRRTVQVGGIASATRDPMFNIVADGVVKLIAEVAESDLPKVKLGQKAEITVNGMERRIAGEVKLISPEVDEKTRIGLVHIRVEEGVRIPLGSFGRAEIALGGSAGVALPLTAVTFGDDGPTVQIVKDGKVEVRKVITGLVGTEDIEITGGVAPGEQVVARAGTFVRDGDAVTPVVQAAGN
jgi:HlyD family secretion protein